MRFPHRRLSSSLLACLAFGSIACFQSGCSQSSPDKSVSTTETNAAAPVTTPISFEAKADDLLAMRLPLEETSQGWVRLFDGHTLFGWEIATQANWRIEDQAIVVDAGNVGLLCTSVAWADYELKLEYQADEETNSGIFLRTPLEPSDPVIDCYEINIAPPSNPFPTGSIVARAKVEGDKSGTANVAADPSAWHLMEIRVVADEVTVSIDSKQVCTYRDPMPLAAGRIGLQHNSGKVAFRDIRIRPIGLEPLLDADLSHWKRYPDMPGEFEVDAQEQLRVTGGRGQIESKEIYGNLIALVEAKTQSEKLNSGLFFRCIPGSVMDGYECQINHSIKNDNPLDPADCGTGGIFRRQNARIVAAEDQEWFSMLLVVDGLQMAAWVNGLQVTDWRDTREPHPNPRTGSRVDAGTLMIQAHDPTTDILFRNVSAGELLPAAPEPVGERED